MLLAIEPLHVPAPSAAIDGVRLLGLEATRRHGAWPTLRHVFDVGHDAALHVEIGPFAECEAYAVGYDAFGDEMLNAL